MARIRSIKPEFWASQSVGRVSRDARLLFIGLWGQADDHGRFRAHPRLLSSAIFPYDDDALRRVPGWLKELEAEGSISLYESGGDSYGVIPRWADHQKIDRPGKAKHPLASPREDSRALDGPPDDTREPSRKIALEGKGGEGRGGAPAPVPEDLRLAWNELKSPEQPEWVEMPETRAKAARARLKERPLDEWRAVISRLARSAFATGTPSADGRKWISDPEFLLRPDSATKILEGKYDDRGGQGPPKSPPLKRVRSVAEDYPSMPPLSGAK